jgi:hypothetical protein
VGMLISFQVVDINQIYRIGKKIAISGKKMVYMSSKLRGW